MLEASLGTTRLLARPGDRRLWLLDAATAALWDLQTAGWTGAPLAGLLAERFGLAPEDARRYLDELQADWRAAGLLEADPSDGRFVVAPTEPPLASPPATAPPPGAWRLAVADRAVSLSIPDEMLRAALTPLLPDRSGADPGPSPEPVADQLTLHGAARHWTLTANGSVLETGQGMDAALVATLHTLTELGCRPAERLLVIHGAGLVAPDGRGLLLIAPGGSGKSTLAAALNAQGCGLLSDDVVPVTPSGELLGLGLPLCLKAGSWPVLAEAWPALRQAPVVVRYGQPVRYLPPAGRAVNAGVRAGLVLFPHYQPDGTPRWTRLTPAQVLQRVVAAEAVIRDLTQAKLEALARWAGAAPAFALTYPDLDHALALVRGRLAAMAAPG